MSRAEEAGGEGRRGQLPSKTEIGWGHQIRSYVLQPYQLVKDLRTGVTSPSPQDVLDGDLDVHGSGAGAARQAAGRTRSRTWNRVVGSLQPRVWVLFSLGIVSKFRY